MSRPSHSFPDVLAPVQFRLKVLLTGWGMGSVKQRLSPNHTITMHRKETRLFSFEPSPWGRLLPRRCSNKGLPPYDENPEPSIVSSFTAGVDKKCIASHASPTTRNSNFCLSASITLHLTLICQCCVSCGAYTGFYEAHGFIVLCVKNP